MTDKVWGTTECLVQTPMFELHRLCIKPMYRCSVHIHRFKHNAFYVITGKLYLDMWPHSIVVCPGESATIPPGVAHQFRTGPDPCECLEMYHTETLSEDIERRNVGGPVDRRPCGEGCGGLCESCGPVLKVVNDPCPHDFCRAAVCKCALSVSAWEQRFNCLDYRRV